MYGIVDIWKLIDSTEHILLEWSLFHFIKCEGDIQWPIFLIDLDEQNST